MAPGVLIAAATPPSCVCALLFAVNELYGRLFATWTLLTCGLCLICARNPTNAAIYGERACVCCCACVSQLLGLLPGLAAAASSSELRERRGVLSAARHASATRTTPTARRAAVLLCATCCCRRHAAVVCCGAGALSDGAAGVQDHVDQGRSDAHGHRRCVLWWRDGGHVSAEVAVARAARNHHHQVQQTHGAVLAVVCLTPAAASIVSSQTAQASQRCGWAWAGTITQCTANSSRPAARSTARKERQQQQQQVATAPTAGGCWGVRRAWQGGSRLTRASG